ncbi:MAG TPA: hypothetical protein VNM37_13140 [Candidatus Dormibacteraeota bacterium]|nr:hypothetical protein [Candidatus Dormibacteraeota bacterium]
MAKNDKKLGKTAKKRVAEELSAEPDPEFVQQLLSFVEGAGPGMGRWAPFEGWMIANGYTKADIEANCKAIYAAAGMTR